MSVATRIAKTNLRLDLRDANHKQTNFEKSGCSGGGSLSPNLQPPSPPSYPINKEPLTATKIGEKYVLLNRIDGSNLRRCIHIQSQQEYVCKVVPNDRYRDVLRGHFRLDSHPNINTVEEVLVGKSCTYIVFLKCFGDLHSYVRNKRNLRESEALSLFKQVASAVAACHSAGIVLRDLKLRKFVFKDQEKTQLKLETLDDAVLLDEDDDWLNDKHGCPAYVSPEILSPTSNYSGKAADCWSLGVMLYTMLVGRYPFHDTEPSGLFSKIRRGCYIVPEHLSSKAKCLIRSLLRMDPSERLTAEEVLDHPWFKSAKFTDELSLCPSDQMVPDFEHMVSAPFV
ncbi:tribbles homolog 2 [Parasteatoda tepidariorum]|uniref:tribbles homolog 2 n=1 Tax=Parasteatoda tepidariorum TaxID=114398 RepID=UPI00077F880E|nr:tribbles homolog 2 [Parasteatoda tepidariorum]XP_015928329.1 tribbles homolog 2 [Parasteatoda tepidariorum]